MQYEKSEVAAWSFNRFSVQHERPRPRARAYAK